MNKKKLQHHHRWDTGIGGCVALSDLVSLAAGRVWKEERR